MKTFVVSTTCIVDISPVYFQSPAERLDDAEMVELPHKRERARFARGLFVGRRLASGHVAPQLADVDRSFTAE